MENAVSLAVPNKVDYESGDTGVILMDKNYGIFKRKHSCRIRSDKERISYMILKVIMVKLKIVLSLVLVPLRASLFFFTRLWRTVQFFTGYLLQLLSNVASNLPMYLGVDWTSFSFGIVSVIILLCILGIS